MTGTEAALRLAPAQEADLPRVAALYRSVIGRPGCAWNDAYPTLEDIALDFSAGGLYVLRRGAEVIGAVSVVPEHELDDLSCWCIADGAQQEIARVVIDPREQGHGYAEAMLKQLFCALKAQGCSAVHLLVAQDNPAALATYRALQFRFLGACTRYGHDYLICEKPL